MPSAFLGKFGGTHVPPKSLLSGLGKPMLDIWCGAARLRRTAPQQAILRAAAPPRTPTHRK